MKRNHNPIRVRFLLAEHGILSAFSADSVESMDVIECPAGSIIMRGEEAAGEIYMLVQGTALVTAVSDEGAEMIISLQRTFEMFGDLEYLLGVSSIANTVEAKTDCVLVAIPSGTADRLKGEPAFLRLLSKGLAEKLAATSDNYSQLALYPLKRRFADFLESIRDDPSVLNNLGTRDLARLLGTTDRQLRRVLADAERDGLILRGPPIAILP